MGIFQKLFGQKPKADPGPIPTRKLNLQYKLTPENARKLSDQFRAAVLANEKIRLDFSIPTLTFVDQFLQRFKDEGLSVNDFAETIFVAGCYVGEVMVHNAGGKWLTQEDAKLPEGIAMMPIVIKLSNGTITDPISKSFKRFHFGAQDDIAYYHQVFTKSS